MTFQFFKRYWVQIGLMFFGLMLTQGEGSCLFAKSPIFIPNYDRIEELRHDLYNLRFLESRPKAQQFIEETQGAERATYESVYSYMELTVTYEKNSKETQAQLESFDKYTDNAILLLEAQVAKEPQNPVWQVYLGAVLAMKGGVDIAVRKSYWNAYKYGMRGVDIFKELRERYPDFYDSSISTGILKIMISRAPWIIQKVASFVVTTGTIEEGLSDLEEVMQKGSYVQTEARMFHSYMMRIKMPDDLRIQILPRLFPLIRQYPGNVQLYILIALGYDTVGDYQKSGYYAHLGMNQLKLQKTQFIERNRIPLQEYLLFFIYKSIARSNQWESLLTQTERGHAPSSVSKTFHALALVRTKQYQKSIQLAKEVLDHLEPKEFSMPFFMAPFDFSVESRLKELLEDIIDANEKQL
ncbi:hypothetical protein WDW89_06705 [Deltaproteobacteria bacterium TL4]